MWAICTETFHILHCGAFRWKLPLWIKFIYFMYFIIISIILTVLCFDYSPQACLLNSWFQAGSSVWGGGRKFRSWVLDGESMSLGSCHWRLYLVYGSLLSVLLLLVHHEWEIVLCHTFLPPHFCSSTWPSVHGFEPLTLWVYISIFSFNLFFQTYKNTYYAIL